MANPAAQQGASASSGATRAPSSSSSSSSSSSLSSRPRPVRSMPQGTQRTPLLSNLRLPLLALVGLVAAVGVPWFLTNTTLAWLESKKPNSAPKNFFGTADTMSIKNVAVAGGTGTLGVPIVNELVKSGFVVTLLTREGSTATPPPGVAAVKPVDYKSVASLSEAIKGQDAVVSVLGSFVIGEQLPLVEAASAPESSVRRFIPSEFGINTRETPGTPVGAILDGKTKLVDLLDEKSKAKPSFTWTGISNGHFFDWGLARNLFGIDPAKRTATVYDSGNERFQASNLPFVAKAVAAVLKQAGTAGDKTANKYLPIASFTPTQNELLAAVQEVTGGADGWTVTRVKSADVQKQAAEKLAKGDFSVFVDLLSVWQFADGAGHAPDLADPQSGNKILGLPEEDFKASVAANIKK